MAKDFVYKVYKEPIKFTTEGTYKNLERVINNLPKNEEFVQSEATPTHLHLITKKYKKQVPKRYQFKIVHIRLELTVEGTYKDLQKHLRKVPDSWELVEIESTFLHMHLILRKELGSGKKRAKRKAKKKK
jgi:hypothetical protein